MDRWGAALYGDPCHECGFDWSIDDDEVAALIARYAGELSRLLHSAAGAEQHPELAWSVGDYVCHVADNLRIWFPGLQLPDQSACSAGARELRTSRGAG